ncbi:hypothetical protein [Chengkuizengella marina]|uniref:Uncharacterized protein n=1 Tax=Chengkuizengella marina TaxID=2507566 RepID=A0A6N9Q285_9BACL|nr:hypothetical protein [Chengkuizengella marina]NBI28594.1 hypothetical protein [Chengkuizengella marina]
MKREKFCMVCGMAFFATRRDAKYCNDVCRQRACRDKKTNKNIYELPKYLRYRVVYYKDTFILAENVKNHKMREWIDSEKDFYRVEENMKQYESVLFICYRKIDMSKVMKIINE